MSPELTTLLENARKAYDAMTAEQKEEMWRAQRESWVRAFAPCEHGDPDWETCHECLSNFNVKKNDGL